MSLQIEVKPGFQPLQEKLVTLYGISWEKFKAIEANLEDIKNVRLSYLKGVLEIMSPIGDKHETVKSTIGILLEAYFREMGIRYYRRGGFTLEAVGFASGTPDESYSIGERQDLPDIVIEVVVTSGTINRTELYEPLKIPEVWFWKAGQLRVFSLQGEKYQEVFCSQLLPNLDLALLLKYVGHPDQYDAVQGFLAEIRQGKEN
ncbi:MAG TPA: Uma2 family endonuclease [Nostocaceae cyanobacterium]|nr:Uma2 family endonuclease [Nostocaceae cyanobacterium]